MNEFDGGTLNKLRHGLGLLGFMGMLGWRAQVQNIPTRTLSRPEAEFATSFTEVTGIRELRDGRVILIDQRDRTIQLLDFVSGKATPIGRQGSGPGEYRLPFAIYALAGDSTAVFDDPNRRLLIILPNGKAGGVLSVVSPGGRESTEFGRIIDARGRSYAAGRAWSNRGEVFQSLDSVPLIRWARGAARADTIGYVGRPPGYARSSMRGRAHVISVGAPPFTAMDQFTVSADGRVAIVDANDYSIQWVDAEGRRAHTAPIAYSPLRVTEAHKNAWRELQKGGVAVIGDDDKGTVAIVGRGKAKVEEPASWPEYMPPFLHNALTFAPDGMLWVKRTGPANAPLTYDVISQSSGLTMRVALPLKSRIVGFGANGVIYVAHTDDDDLQHLRRYRLG